jgi:hypothetical protein
VIRVRAALAIAAALLIACAFSLLRPAGEPGVVMRDFSAYYAAGATWLAHGNPYGASIGHVEHRAAGAGSAELLPFVGLPATLPFWALFARFHYVAAAHLWLALLVLSALALFTASLALSGGASSTDPVLKTGGAALVLLSFVPFTSDFGLGQSALPACAAITAGVALLSRSTAGASLTFAIASLQPNLAVASAAVLGRVRGVAALGSAALLCYAAGAFAAGPDWIGAYLQVLARHGAAERFSSIQITPAAIAYGFGAPERGAMLFGVAVAAIVLGLGVAAVMRTPALEAKFAIACCAIPFVTFFVHEHDLIVLYFPLLYCLRYAPAALRPVALFAGVLVAVNWLDFAQQPQAVGQDIALACAAILSPLVLPGAGDRPAEGLRRFPRLRFASLGTTMATASALGLVALGAWVGAHHPLPIWPNDMTAFTPPASAGAAAMWHEEQLHTGLLMPHPASALLRSFSLAGCASLLCVSIRCRRS